MTFVVDNLSSFERRARENAGEKVSALEIAGQATDRNAGNSVGAKQQSDPKLSGKRLPPGMWESTPEPDRPKIIWPERAQFSPAREAAGLGAVTRLDLRPRPADPAAVSMYEFQLRCVEGIDHGNRQ